MDTFILTRALRGPVSVGERGRMLASVSVEVRSGTAPDRAGERGKERAFDPRSR